eukprot:404670-Alexandrium_andersonii.AAC.1
MVTRGRGRPAAAGPILPASCWQPKGLEGWDTVVRSVLGFRASGALLAPPIPMPPSCAVARRVRAAISRWVGCSVHQSMTSA